MKKIVTLLFVFVTAVNLSAQQDFIMYNLQDIPQSAYSNPSNRFNGNFYLGIPALSSNYFSFSNTGFSYTDAVKKSGDSLLLDFNSLLAELKDENFLSFNTKIDLLSFGISLGKSTQLTVNITENANFRFSYTKDFMDFIHKGNAAFSDDVANFDGLGISFNHYREYGIGVSHQLTKELRIGARAKYLYGMENIYSKKTDISLRTDPVTFALTAKADVEVQTSGFGDNGDESTINQLTGRNNSGFAIDLGGDFQFSEKLSFNASIIDLGFINWNDYNKTYSIANGEYTYDGIEVSAFTNESEGEDGNTSFDRVLDSLEEDFKVVETEEAYTSPLTARFYLGANYKLNESTMVGGIIQSEIFQGDILPSLTASINRKMTKWITLAASYTVIHGSFTNLGFGFNLNPGPVQFYVVSDNILGAFKPQDTRFLQMRFGINLIFGSEKTKEINPSYQGVFEEGGEKKEKKEKKKKTRKEVVEEETK